MESMKIIRKPSNVPCVCPPPDCILPDEPVRAAMSGDIDKALSYYWSGGDINTTAGRHGWTILGAACSRGRSHLVEKLLTLPEVHLNVLSLLDMPVAWAIREKHTECAEMIIRCSTLECVLDVNTCWPSLLSFMSCKPDIFFDITYLLAGCKDLRKFKELVRLRDRNFEVNIELLKAAIEPSDAKVKNCLKSEGMQKYMDGTLTAIACFGTNDQVALHLIPSIHEYSKDCLETSLILSSMNNNLSFLPRLLQIYIGTLSYESLGKAQEAAIKKGHTNVIRLLEVAINVKCEFCMAEACNEIEPKLRPGAFSCVLGGRLSTAEEVIRPPVMQEADIEVGSPVTEESNFESVASTVPTLIKEAVEAIGVLAEESTNLVVLLEKQKETAGASTEVPSDEVFKVIIEVTGAQVKITKSLHNTAYALSRITREVSKLAMNVSGKDLFGQVAKDKNAV